MYLLFYHMVDFPSQTFLLQSNPLILIVLAFCRWFLVRLMSLFVRRPFPPISQTERQQGCQMAKFDPFLSLDCAWVEGVGAQRNGSNFAIWQPC